MPRLSVILVAVAALFCLIEPTLAQSSLGIGNAEVAMQPGTGPLSGLFLWIGSVQREFFTGLRQGLVALRSGEGGIAPGLVVAQIGDDFLPEGRVLEAVQEREPL